MREDTEVEVLDKMFGNEVFERENDLSDAEKEILAKKLAFNEYVVNKDYDNATVLIEVMNDFGYIGICLLIMIENLFPPIPSELILTFGGFMTFLTSLILAEEIIEYLNEESKKKIYALDKNA